MPKAYVPNDRFAKRAQYQGFRARSVYKLEELDQKFNLFHPGQFVLDVGAAPGSWLQYISQKIVPKGKVIGIDIQPILPVETNVFTLLGDVRDLDLVKAKMNELSIDKFDLVVSDIAPSTTGITGVDQARSVELSQIVVDAADEFLRFRGILVMKVFQGEAFKDFYHALQNKYGYVTTAKVKASRDRSSEIYVVCQRKK
jgi:23S rRNA (uridine2552-2'-O)-methyltransferase